MFNIDVIDGDPDELVSGFVLTRSTSTRTSKSLRSISIPLPGFPLEVSFVRNFSRQFQSFFQQRYQLHHHDFLEKLAAENHNVSKLSFHRTPFEVPERKLEILAERDLRNSDLLHDLESRGVKSHFAREYCREIDFRIGEKAYLAIGFSNRSGGFELRNRWFTPRCCFDGSNGYRLTIWVLTIKNLARWLIYVLLILSQLFPGLYKTYCSISYQYHYCRYH